MPPPAELQKKARDGISRVQKVAAVELGFRGAPGCLGGTWIYIGRRIRSVEQRGPHEGGGRAQGVGAPLPRGFLVGCLTSTPNPLDHVCSKNHAPEGFIPFGLRLIFFFRETLK